MEGLKARFIAQSIRLADAKRKSAAQNNRAMDALMEIYREFAHDPDAAAPILAELLAHPHPWVRLGAAVQSLGLGLYVARAEQLLTALAQSSIDMNLAFEAEICLVQWRKGMLLLEM